MTHRFRRHQGGRRFLRARRPALKTAVRPYGRKTEQLLATKESVDRRYFTRRACRTTTAPPPPSSSSRCRSFADSHAREHLVLLRAADPTDSNAPPRPRCRALAVTRVHEAKACKRPCAPCCFRPLVSTLSAQASLQAVNTCAEQHWHTLSSLSSTREPVHGPWRHGNALFNAGAKAWRND